eukprot:gnl/MRDRNA2_/MRDRNA2_79200_c0_seq1.p1 gnl/MRDRNA2_/MRDRNA2_79200_c0~~gnl/MRDRNA2_/MRDRNA2_79200_c0_seq1.p1  ORF type:complete len:325 (+),score=48.69 gnl/MRDRNA2_/MRDRNA2_79200_c0_seq1:59-1033(+)
MKSMAKSSVVCLFLALNVAHALKLQISMRSEPDDPELTEEYLQMVSALYDPKLDWEAAPDGADSQPSSQRENFKDPSVQFSKISTSHPAVKTIKAGTGEFLNSGDAFALESEVEPGLFITLREPGDWGNPLKWCEFKRITNGIMGLESGITPDSTFTFHKKENTTSSTIVSGDMVAWKHGEDQITVLAQKAGYMWPYPFSLQKKPGKRFKIEHAREVDIKAMQSKWQVQGGWGYHRATLKDQRKGEPIKDGDAVWIKLIDEIPASGGICLYLAGDVGEGYHVAFTHHYPGFDGLSKNYAVKYWMQKGGDPHSTAQRFTIRKISQ